MLSQSKGHPFRNGQWVKTRADLTYPVLVEGEPVDRTMPKGTIGIYHIAVEQQPIEVVVQAAQVAAMQREFDEAVERQRVAIEKGEHIPPLPSRDEVLETRPDGAQRVRRIVNRPSARGEFHRVDKRGFETVRIFKIVASDQADRAADALTPDLLEAVTSRDEIPAERLATMSPDFVPQP